jgi:hypothetical protein
MITPNADGTYSVRFYKRDAAGQLSPVEVVVEATFPVSDGSNGRRIPALFYQDEGGRVEYWAQLIEKAYAQEFFGGGDPVLGYAQMGRGGTPGAVLEALTGQPSTTYITGFFPSIDDLHRLHQEGYALTMGSRPIALFNPVYEEFGGQGLITRHAYYISEVDPVSGRIVVRNPWDYDKFELNLSYEQYSAAFLALQITPTQVPPASGDQSLRPTPAPVPVPRPDEPTPAPVTPTPVPSPSPTPRPISTPAPVPLD